MGIYGTQVYKALWETKIKWGKLRWSYFDIPNVVMEKAHSNWILVNWTLRNKFRLNLNRNSIVSIQENLFVKVICEKGDHFVQGEMPQ